MESESPPGPRETAFCAQPAPGTTRYMETRHRWGAQPDPDDRGANSAAAPKGIASSGPWPRVSHSGSPAGLAATRLSGSDEASMAEPFSGLPAPSGTAYSETPFP